MSLTRKAGAWALAGRASAQAMSGRSARIAALGTPHYARQGPGRSTAEGARHLVAREHRERAAVAEDDAAPGLRGADRVGGNPEAGERLARLGRTSDREGREQGARGQRAPRIGAEGTADGTARPEPEHPLRIDDDAHARCLRELREARREPP